MTRKCTKQWLNEPTEAQLREERERLEEWRKTAKPSPSWFLPPVSLDEEE